MKQNRSQFLSLVFCSLVLLLCALNVMANNACLAYWSVVTRLTASCCLGSSETSTNYMYLSYRKNLQRSFLSIYFLYQSHSFNPFRLYTEKPYLEKMLLPLFLQMIEAPSPICMTAWKRSAHKFGSRFWHDINSTLTLMYCTKHDYSNDCPLSSVGRARH